MDRSYYIGKYEVTRGEFEEFLQSEDVIYLNPNQIFMSYYNAFPGIETPKHPIVKVNRYTAIVYCNWLTKKHNILDKNGLPDTCYTLKVVPFGGGANNLSILEVNADYNKKGYRLPTEAEWEIAARAGSNKLYFFGDDNALFELYDWPYTSYEEYKTHPVGSKKPSPYGLYDIYGNVSELCWDAYDAGYYFSQDALGPNPMGPGNGGGVSRGGRSAARSIGIPSISLGFRLAKTL